MNDLLGTKHCTFVYQKISGCSHFHDNTTRVSYIIFFLNSLHEMDRVGQNGISYYFDYEFFLQYAHE
jgi:hypothetical protein